MVNQPPPRSAPAGGGVILMLGILSIVVLPLLGPFAWVFGNQALAAIRAGTMNPAEGSSASAGRICGIIGTLILIAGAVIGIIYVVFITVFVRPIVMKTMNQAVSDSPTSTIPARPAPPKKPGSHGGDSLTNAIVMGNTAEAESIIKRDPSSVNKKDATGQTPLFMAAFVGNAKITRLLVSHGADVNAKDGVGHTPLDNAVFFHHDDVAAIIKQHGGHAGKGM